jgi:hypothetical protein
MNSPAFKTSTMTMNHSLASQLKQIGLRALPTQLDDFIARVTKAHCSAHQILEELAKAESTERSRRSLECRLRISGIKRFKPMADFDWSWPKVFQPHFAPTFWPLILRAVVKDELFTLVHGSVLPALSKLRTLRLTNGFSAHP